MFEDTRVKLEQWGLWANRTGINLGFKSQMGALLRNNTASVTKVLSISDDDAEKVDLAVGQLKRVDLICFECVILRYRFNLPTTKMAKQLNQSRPTVEKNLLAAEAWLDRALSGFDRIDLDVA